LIFGLHAEIEMALFRIACAAAALIYIAPHLGSQIAETARPVLEPASLAAPAEATASAVMAYCQQHREACIRFARLAIEEVSARAGAAAQTESHRAEAPSGESMHAESSRTESLHGESGGGFGLRSALPGFVPLPPVRPAFDKP
jgi:hypothetical protein